MKKFLAILMAAVLAVTTSMAASTPARAFFPFWGLAIAAGVGLAAGAAIADEHSREVADQTPVAGGAVTATPSDHVTACQNRYRSYSVSSDTFLGRGGVRHKCLL